MEKSDGNEFYTEVHCSQRAIYSGNYGDSFYGKQIELDVPVIRELLKSRKIEMILDNVREVFEDRKLAQKAGIYLAHRYSGARLRELGAYFGKKDSAIAQTTRRFTDEIAANKELKTIVDNLGKKLKLS